MEDEVKQKAEKGTPKWIVTFADLMSLLLTFFILLLSFAEINATKFRKISGSLKMAFGVQRVSVFDEAPKGSSFIQSEYRAGSSGAPPLSTSSSNVNLLDPQLQSIKNSMEKNNRIALIEKQKKLERNVKKVYKKLSKEIKAGKVEITHKDQNLIIRIAENATFAKNRAKLHPNFTKLLDKVADILNDVDGDISVAGHTDDKKLVSRKYKTHWDLSAARALTLSQALIKKGDIDSERITVQAHGSTRPIVRNNSEINRRKNRRVEIIIKH